MTNNWLFRGEPFDENLAKQYFGFVYIISNIETGKKYLGRKYFKMKKVVQKDKKKSKITVESDWRNYYGSSEDLLKDIELLGKDKFKREIIALCKGIGSTNFMEVKMQFEYKVLESNDWYNRNISGKYFNDRTQKYITEEIERA